MATITEGAATARTGCGLAWISVTHPCGILYVLILYVLIRYVTDQTMNTDGGACLDEVRTESAIIHTKNFRSPQCISYSNTTFHYAVYPGSIYPHERSPRH